MPSTLNKSLAYPCLQWREFDEFSLKELYAILQLRQQVFVVEQNCPFLDADGKDDAARHLMAWREDMLAGYLRIHPPQAQQAAWIISRVVVADNCRGMGQATQLMTETLRYISELAPHASVRLSAQSYLVGFYEEFGFAKEGEAYEEDGIPHIDMVLKL